MECWISCSVCLHGNHLTNEWMVCLNLGRERVLSRRWITRKPGVSTQGHVSFCCVNFTEAPWTTLPGKQRHRSVYFWTAELAVRQGLLWVHCLAHEMLGNAPPVVGYSAPPGLGRRLQGGGKGWLGTCSVQDPLRTWSKLAQIATVQTQWETRETWCCEVGYSP